MRFWFPIVSGLISVFLSGIGTASYAASVYQVICRVEPCTYDPDLQQDPNRHVEKGGPNIVMVEMTPGMIKNMTEEERQGLVIFTNNIGDSVQEAGEKALQNTGTNSANWIDRTANTKPTTLLVYTRSSGNFISNLMVSAYEKGLASSLGYSTADEAMQAILMSAGKSATVVGHGHGTKTIMNALKMLHKKNVVNDQMVIQVKGSVSSLEEMTQLVNAIRSNDDVKKDNLPQYVPVAHTFEAITLGSLSNGQKNHRE